MHMDGNAKVDTTYDWRVYADATCAGMSVLIPLPLVDLSTVPEGESLRLAAVEADRIPWKGIREARQARARGRGFRGRRPSADRLGPGEYPTAELAVEKAEEAARAAAEAEAAAAEAAAAEAAAAEAAAAEAEAAEAAAEEVATEDEAAEAESTDSVPADSSIPDGERS